MPDLPGADAGPALPDESALPELPDQTTPTLPTEGVPSLPDPGVELPVEPAAAISAPGGWQPIHALPLAAAGATALGAAAKARMGTSEPTSPVSDEEAQAQIESRLASRWAQVASGDADPSSAFAEHDEWQFDLAGYRLHLSGTKGTWHVLAPGATEWVNTAQGPRRVIFGVVDEQLVARPTGDAGDRA